MESLSIATAVVQFIDFAGLLIKVGRLVWEGQGVPDALDAHAYSQNVLDNVKRMRGYLTNDSDFQKLVDRCEVLAKDIALMFPKSLAKTQSKPKRVLKAGAATLRHVWHKSDFDEKLERLNILSGALRDRIAGEGGPHDRRFPRRRTSEEAPGAERCRRGRAAGAGLGRPGDRATQAREAAPQGGDHPAERRGPRAATSAPPAISAAASHSVGRASACPAATSSAVDRRGAA